MNFLGMVIAYMIAIAWILWLATIIKMFWELIIF